MANIKTATPIKATLTAQVKHFQGKKCRTVTDVRILLQGITIARGEFGGKYSAEQALAEYKRNPGHFKVNAAHAATAKLLGAA